MDVENLKIGTDAAAATAAGLTIYKTLIDLVALQRAGVEDATEHRIKIKAELEALLGSAQANDHQELIIVDAARADGYPAPDEKLRLRTISPWFKSEGWRFDSGGLEVGHNNWTRILIKGNRAEIVRKGGEYMLLGMRIPFASIIRSQDYDNAYGLPLLYCHFRCRRHLPYESVEVYRETTQGYEHLEGIRFKNRAALREAIDLPRQVKAHLAQRRFDREVEKRRRMLEPGGS